jgi:hypothetical protein
MKGVSLAALVLAGSLHAQWSAPAQGGFGVATLPDGAVAARLASRFKATGSPVFLIGNPAQGLQPGDIVRFKDRAVLIDADVWQSLRADGALAALKIAPVVRVKAAANPAAWAGRAKAVPAGKERRAYELGEQLLRVFQKSFASTPDGQKLFLTFENGQLVLSAPPGFIDNLRTGKLENSAPGEDAHPASGMPHFASTAPGLAFLGRPFRWDAWAVDLSGGPTRDLQVELSGSLPPGLVWDRQSHRLSGTPTQEGRWPLVVRASNASGTDSLAFPLAVVRHVPPRFAAGPGPAEPGRPWSFRPEVLDSLHPLRDVAVRASGLPPGMAWDSIGQVLSWTPPDSLLGRTVGIGLCARDLLGDSACVRWDVPVRRPDLAVSSEGLRPVLPWDSLTAGHVYRWRLSSLKARWAREGASLRAAVSDDSLGVTDSVLELRPTRPGTYRISLAAEREGKTDSVKLALGVRQDLPPRFLSRLESDSLRCEQGASYRPVAVDPEGDPVRLSVVLPPGSPILWDGERLVLPPGHPGQQHAQVVAADPYGHESRQDVDWFVDPSGKGLFLEGRDEDGIGLWSLGTDLGPGRIGLFTPRLGQLDVGDRLGMELPYLFLGVNFLRTRQDRLTLDAGVTARSPADHVFTGGGMARLQGSFVRTVGIPWKCDLDVTGWIDQAILVADTSGSRIVSLAWANYNANPAWNLDEVESYRTSWWPAIEKARQDQIRRDNSVVLGRLELLAGVEPWAWVGPSTWVEARPQLNQAEMFAGLAAKSDVRLGPVRLSPYLRAGYGFGGTGLTVSGSFLVNLGGE